MSKNESLAGTLKMNDLVSRTVMNSLMAQDNKFEKKEVKHTQRWLESQCDCA